MGTVPTLCGERTGMYGVTDGAVSLAGPSGKLTLRMDETVQITSDCSITLVQLGEAGPDGAVRTAWFRESTPHSPVS